MGNIIKRDLVESLATETGLSQTQSKAIVNLFFEAVKDALKLGNNIEIRGFGRFKLKEKPSKTARNPKTGEKVKLGKRTIPIFKASKLFIDKVNKSITQK